MKLGSRKRSSQALLNKPIEGPIVDSIDDYEDNKMLLKDCMRLSLLVMQSVRIPNGFGSLARPKS